MKLITKKMKLALVMASAALIVLPGMGTAGTSETGNTVGQLLYSSNQTPNGEGLLMAVEVEALMAASFANQLIKAPANLEIIKERAKDLRDAIVPTSGNLGNGRGYGLIQAAEKALTAVDHLSNARQVGSDTGIFAKKTATEMRNIVNWSKEVLVQSDRVLAARTTTEAMAYAQEIKVLTSYILFGISKVENNAMASKNQGGIAKVVSLKLPMYGAGK